MAVPDTITVHIIYLKITLRNKLQLKELQTRELTQKGLDINFFFTPYASSKNMKCHNSSSARPCKGQSNICMLLFFLERASLFCSFIRENANKPNSDSFRALFKPVGTEL